MPLATVLTAIRALHARRRTPVEGFRRVWGTRLRRLGVALAASVASFEFAYEVGVIVVAATSIGGDFIASITLTPAATKVGGSGGVRKHGIQPVFDIS